MKNTPTKKVENLIDYGLTVTLNNGVTLVARKDLPYGYESIDPKTGNSSLTWLDEKLAITSHKGLMPAFYIETFDTIQELADKMREYKDLRFWRIVK